MAQDGVKVVLVVVCGASASAKAAVFDLSFSGRIVDRSGVPLSGPVDITARFFGSISGTDQLGATFPSTLRTPRYGIPSRKARKNALPRRRANGSGCVIGSPMPDCHFLQWLTSPWELFLEGYSSVVNSPSACRAISKNLAWSMRVERASE